MRGEGEKAWEDLGWDFPRQALLSQAQKMQTFVLKAKPRSEYLFQITEVLKDCMSAQIMKVGSNEPIFVLTTCSPSLCAALYTCIHQRAVHAGQVTTLKAYPIDQR